MPPTGARRDGYHDGDGGDDGYGPAWDGLGRTANG